MHARRPRFTPRRLTVKSSYSCGGRRLHSHSVRPAPWGTRHGPPGGRGASQPSPETRICPKRVQASAQRALAGHAVPCSERHLICAAGPFAVRVACPTRSPRTRFGPHAFRRLRRPRVPPHGSICVSPRTTGGPSVPLKLRCRSSSRGHHRWPFRRTGRPRSPSGRTGPACLLLSRISATSTSGSR